MKVRFAETALAEIDAILSYIASRNPTAAIAMRERIESAATQIGDFPYSAPVTDEPGVHQMVVRGFPYLVFYNIEGDGVFVVHVWHGARRKPWEQTD